MSANFCMFFVYFCALCRIRREEICERPLGYAHRVPPSGKTTHAFLALVSRLRWRPNTCVGRRPYTGRRELVGEPSADGATVELSWMFLWYNASVSSVFCATSLPLSLLLLAHISGLRRRSSYWVPMVFIKMICVALDGERRAPRPPFHSPAPVRVISYNVRDP